MPVFRRFSEKEQKPIWVIVHLRKKTWRNLYSSGEYLGYLDITLQKNTVSLYLEQLKKEIEDLQRELPTKQKLYQSMGTLGGIFLAIMLL